MLTSPPRIHQLNRLSEGGIAGFELTSLGRWHRNRSTPPTFAGFAEYRQTVAKLPASKTPLLHFHCRSRLGELLPDALRLVFGDTLFYSLGGAIDQVLGFLEAQAGHFADSFDYIDLIGSDFFQDDGKFGLFLSRSRAWGCATTASHHDRGCCRCRHPQPFFQLLYQSRCVDQRKAYDLFFQLLEIRHGLGLHFPSVYFVIE